jgi:hypothetical protein
MAAWLSGAAARTAWRALDLAGSSRPVEAGPVPVPVQQPHAQDGQDADGQADQAGDDPAVGRGGGRLGRGRGRGRRRGSGRGGRGRYGPDLQGRHHADVPATAAPADGIDGAELALALAASPDDPTTAIGGYETEMFERTAAAQESADIMKILTSPAGAQGVLKFLQHYEAPPAR